MLVPWPHQPTAPRRQRIGRGGRRRCGRRLRRASLALGSRHDRAPTTAGRHGRATLLHPPRGHPHDDLIRIARPVVVGSYPDQSARNHRGAVADGTELSRPEDIFAGLIAIRNAPVHRSTLVGNDRIATAVSPRHRPIRQACHAAGKKTTDSNSQDAAGVASHFLCRFFGDISGLTSENEVLKALLRCPKSSGTCRRPRKQPAAEWDRRRATSTFGALQTGLFLGELHHCRARFTRHS
jgi:hypothetical protein